MGYIRYPNLVRNGAGVGNIVIGPLASTIDAIPRFADTTGETLLNSGVLIDSSNNVTGINSLTVNTLEALTTVTTGDNQVILNDQVTNVPFSGNSGLIVTRGTSPNAQLYWNETTGTWQFGVVGSMQDIGFGGGSQTPWTSDIDAAGYALGNVGHEVIGDTLANWDTVSALQVNGQTVTDTLQLRGLTADPPSPADGSMWYRSDVYEFRVSIDGVTYKLPVSPV